VWEADERFRSSMLQTLATAFDAWLEPTVARATSSHGGIDPAWLPAAATRSTSERPRTSSTA
jgi:hypothetical protein